MLSDIDARYLEGYWLSQPRHLHNGTQLSALPWREEEYAHYVGRVLTEAAKCDVMLCELLLSARALLGEPPKGIVGESGKTLAKALCSLGEYSPAFQDLGERYGAWYELRNFAVHGIRHRDPSGAPVSQVSKVNRPTGARSVQIDVCDQDFDDLALLWRAFNALSHDAYRAIIELGGGGSAREILGRLSVPNTVSTSERLPAGS